MIRCTLLGHRGVETQYDGGTFVSCDRCAAIFMRLVGRWFKTEHIQIVDRVDRRTLPPFEPVLSERPEDGEEAGGG